MKILSPEIGFPSRTGVGFDPSKSNSGVLRGGRYSFTKGAGTGAVNSSRPGTGGAHNECIIPGTYSNGRLPPAPKY